MEHLWSKPEFTRRKMLIGAAGIFAVGALAGGLGVAAFERISQDSPLKPESGDAQSNLVIEWLPDTVKRWKSQIEKYSSMYEIDPNLLAIMMTVESGGDPAADSGVAQGLMQITKPTADDIAKKYLKVEKTDFDLKTPETSIEFGAAYVRYLVGEFGDASQGPSWDETVSLVAAGYNGGPGGAIAYRDHKWKGLEEYAQQTFNYTRYVRVMWQERHDDKSFAYRFWYEQGNGQALVKDAEKYAAP